MTQQQVTYLLGYKRERTVARIESGGRLPGLIAVLKLSAILRVPVEFLYQDMYEVLKADIRKREESMPVGRQGILPLLIK
jgi:DNA-binding XRE family transcriptional regulator